MSWLDWGVFALGVWFGAWFGYGLAYRRAAFELAKLIKLWQPSEKVVDVKNQREKG